MVVDCGLRWCYGSGLGLLAVVANGAMVVGCGFGGCAVVVVVYFGLWWW